MVVLVGSTASVSICRAIHQRHEPDVPTLAFGEVALGTLTVLVIEGFAVVGYTEAVGSFYRTCVNLKKEGIYE
jgi:hypothetical protein